MSAYFAPDRFAHANLYVADMERSLAFYRDVCGLNEVYREPEISAGFLSNGSSHHDIAVMQVSNRAAVGRDGKVQNTMARGRVPGLNHLAFRMKSEARMVDAYRRARENGVAVERALDHGMSHSIYLLDPDLNGVEFYADVVADWRAFYKSKDHALISARWDPLAAPPLPDIDTPPPVFDHVASAPLHPREILGATLAVKDLSRALDFYTDVAGLTVKAHDSNEGIALLSIPGAKEACLALVAADDGETAGVRSLWFSLKATSPALAGDGPAGLVRKTDSAGRLERLSLHDPDGMALLFFIGGLPRAPVAAAVQ